MKTPNKLEVNESYNFVSAVGNNFSFRVFAITKEGYHIITDTFELFKVQKTEMINNIQNGKIHFCNKEIK